MYSWYDYFLLFMGGKIIVEGLEKVPFGQRFVVICNHRSNFDHMVISTVLKKEYLCFISKPENFKIPFAGRIANRAMYLSLPRNDVKGSLNVIIKAIDYIKTDFMSIGLFPEGTRSKNGKVLEFKPGCLKIPLKAKCPLVEIVMDGTEKLHKNFPFKKTKLKVKIVKVYTTEELSSMNTVTLSYEIRNSMIMELNKMDI